MSMSAFLLELSLSVNVSTCVLFGVVAGSVQVFLWYRKRVARSKELPFPNIPYAIPNPHWLLGHIKLVGSDIIEGQRRLLVEHAGGDKSVSTCYILNVPTFTTVDANLMSRILLASSERHGAKGHVRHFKYMFGEETILMQNGAAWKESRLRIYRALHAYDLSKLQTLLSAASLRVQNCICNEIRQSPQGVLEITALDLCRMAALDVMGLSCFAYDFECTKGVRFERPPILQDILFLQEELTRRAFLERLSISAQWYQLPTPANRRHARARVNFRNAMKNVIQHRRDHPRAHGETAQFIDHILESSIHANDDELADWLQTSLIGGFDTTGIALANTLYLLCKHPDWQKECRLEAQRTLNHAMDTTTTHETTDFPLISACFYEAIRLYPPATITARNLSRPFHFELDGRKIVLEKGTRIICPFYWINRSERNFQLPNKFLPTRWAQRKPDRTWETRTTGNDLGGDVGVAQGSSNLSFSSGARNCVGRVLAMRMARTMLAAMLRNTEFELADEAYEVKLERCGSNAVPKGGVPLRVRVTG